MKLLPLIVACALAGCKQDSAPINFSDTTQPGVAIVLLVDSSGSMSEQVSSQGEQQQKHIVARKALQGIVDYTSHWKQTHPDDLLKIAIYNFNGSICEVLPIGPFDEARVKATVEQIPKPGGMTAIGKALTAGFSALYASGCARKHLVCITDGDNTAGPNPEGVARELFDKSKGNVHIHFIAFDTSAGKFSFLKETNGEIWEAANGEQLCGQLSLIFEKRILAEKEEP